MSLTIILLACTICLFAVYLLFTLRYYSYFKRHGIPGPPYEFFFGHYRYLWSTKFITRQFQSWTQKFGSIYGLYLGTTPMYVVSDADFLQEVYVKQFSSFQSRHLPVLLRLQTGNKIHLVRAIGSRWRRQRHVLNPTFSAAKLKSMSLLVENCIETMLNKVSESVDEKQKEINIYDLYKRMTMDVICCCAFGINTDMQNDHDNIYLRKCGELFRVDVDRLLIVKLTNLLPWFDNLFRYLYLGITFVIRTLVRLYPPLEKYIAEAPGLWLINRVKEVVDFRNKTSVDSEKRLDLLQSMIDASTRNDIQDYDDDQLMSKVLHADEVISNVFLFMIAGYETTSTSLAYSTYVIATKPEIQEKLFEEMKEYQWKTMTRDERYDKITNLTYLDLFIREVLRMYPITAQVMTRECNTTSIVAGHTIEKGCVIQPDVFSIHYNPDLWGPEDPYIFYPERHLVKRHPMSWMPFGAGPRICIGMRFALLELKMCLISLLTNYRITTSEQTEEGFRLNESLVIQPEAIYIRLEKRVS